MTVLMRENRSFDRYFGAIMASVAFQAGVTRRTPRNRY
jgi:phospholipase C